MDARTNGRLPAVAAISLSLLAGAALPAAAAEDDAAGGLCRLIDIDAIAAMTGQAYEAPPFWDMADNCKYLATTDPDGRHYVRLHLDSLYPYETYREGMPTAVDLEVGGLPAFAWSDVNTRDELDTQVSVDVGESTFRVTLIAPDGADPNQLDHAISIAETAVAGLGPLATSPAETTGDAGGVPSLDLPSVDGIEWRGESEGYGETLADSGLGLPFIDVLLDATGADMAHLGIHSASARDIATGDDLGGYVAIRVVDVDPTSLEQATLEWVAALLGDQPATIGPAMLAGREVVAVTPEDGAMRAYVYVEGDTIHLVSMPELAAAKVLEVLP